MTTREQRLECALRDLMTSEGGEPNRDHPDYDEAWERAAAVLAEPAPGEQLQTASDPEVSKWVVTYTATPTSYNRPQTLVVEAAHEYGAGEIARHHLGDTGTGITRYVYDVQPHTPPPAGRVVGGGS